MTEQNSTTESIPLPTHRQFDNLTDRVFTWLTVINFAGKGDRGQSMWRCRCKCNNVIVRKANALKTGNTKSCGCYKDSGDQFRKHDRSGSRIYKSYHAMINRCYNEDNDRYSNYGGLGITVCQRWLDDIANFIEDMGERPKNKTLDRKNSKGNYDPSNTRWATPKTQAQNRSSTKLNADLVRQMRKAYDSGRSIASIHRDYAPHVKAPATILHAVKRQTWRNI